MRPDGMNPNDIVIYDKKVNETYRVSSNVEL